MLNRIEFAPKLKIIYLYSRDCVFFWLWCAAVRTEIAENMTKSVPPLETCAESPVVLLDEPNRVNNDSKPRLVSRVVHPIDVLVGSRVRLRRQILRMSQERLGEELGLTFQQIQKYERGANRIVASRLFELSQILGVPIDFFYNGSVANTEAAGGGVAAGPPAVIASRDSVTLSRSFVRIKDQRTRVAMIQLLRALAGE
jgi:transcriptional regulator with XRE-family HTH domain